MIAFLPSPSKRETIELAEEFRYIRVCVKMPLCRNHRQVIFHRVSHQLKAPALLSKPCQTTSGLVGRVYAAAGQAGGALHTKAVLHIYQANLLKYLDQGQGLSPEVVAKLQRNHRLGSPSYQTDIIIISCSMVSLVVMEMHLWLNLLGTKEKDKYFPLDQSPFQLFGISIEMSRDSRRRGRSLPTSGDLSPIKLSPDPWPPLSLLALLQEIPGGRNKRLCSASLVIDYDMADHDNIHHPAIRPALLISFLKHFFG